MGLQPSRVRPRVLAPFAVIAMALLALANSLGANDLTYADDGDASAAPTVIVDLRVWQHVEHSDNIWITWRLRGSRWSSTVPFPLDKHGFSFERHSFHWFRDLAVPGAALRVWQRYSAPERIFVQVCVTPCRDWLQPFSQTNPRLPEEIWEAWPPSAESWKPLGKFPLPLDDGLSRSGRYRYGNLSVAIPIGNPGLAADREHLLALRDALAGSANLNWSTGTRTSEWDGVSVSGEPPRVTGLNLAGRGLDGELWGWLGELSELQELRLDNNYLTGVIPTKLATLSKLTQLYLAGNEFDGCVPPPLRLAAESDLTDLDLPYCALPIVLPYERYLEHEFRLRHTGSEAKSYRWSYGTFTAVFDLPAGIEFRISHRRDEETEWGFMDCPPCHQQEDFVRWGALALEALIPPDPDNPTWPVWLVLNDIRGREFERSHYLEENEAAFSIVEQIAASVWVVTPAPEPPDLDDWILP